MNIFTRRQFLHTTALASLAAIPQVGAQDTGARPAKIRIGQIGTAHAHAAGKMDTMRKSAEYEVVGVVEPDAERRAKAELSATYQGVPWMTEEQLLNTPGLQAVAVETGIANLVPTATRCIAAGKHVHLDKPGGESLPAFKALLDDATRRKLTVQMGYMFRYNPGVLLLRQFLKEGWLGDIFEVHTVISKVVPPDPANAPADTMAHTTPEP